jgi:putative hemolysin
MKALGSQPSNGSEQDFTEDELRMLVTENRNLRQDEKEMINGVLEFKDTTANEIMVPRTDIIGLPATSTVIEAIKLFKETGLSRIPVYDETLDDILGVLTVKDILSNWSSALPDSLIGDISRPAYHVPETKRITELLSELRSQNIHMAILVDEYGGTAGLVTLEDLIEEIVGEIRDEFDPKAEEHFEAIDDSTAIVDGIYSLDELNEKLPISLPQSDSYETTGGFMLTRLGRIPEVGDKVCHNGWILKIDQMDGHRVAKILISQHRITDE